MIAALREMATSSGRAALCFPRSGTGPAFVSLIFVLWHGRGGMRRDGLAENLANQRLYAFPKSICDPP